MSLWIPSRSEDGRLHWYLVDLPIFSLMAFLGFFLVVMLDLAINAPLESLLAVSSVLFLGFLAFLAAKISVYQNGFWFSFGSNRMTSGMRRLYRLGYLLMIPASIMTLLLSILVLRFHG